VLRLTHPSLFLAWTLSVTLVFIGIDLMLYDDVSQVFKEEGAIEYISAVHLIGATALWYGLKPGPTSRRDWHIPVLLILAAMRELDFDKRFTSNGVLQLRLYSADGPLVEKLIGAAVVILLLVALVRLVRRNLRDWLHRLRHADPSAWLVLLALAAIAVAKSLDGAGRKLAPLGIDLDPSVGIRLGRLEELLELVAALTLIQAIVYFRRDWGQRFPKQADRRP
jgi:hypothetical protein